MMGWLGDWAEGYAERLAEEKNTMKRYIGTKIIHAEPSTGPEGDEDGYTVVYEDGYRSWSPRAVFEEAYQPTERMAFSGALHMLKRGHKVARAGWNGKGMWLAYQPGSTIYASHARGGAALARAEEMRVGSENTSDQTITILPHIDMRAADGSIVVGWLASQTDLLAEDWEVLP